MWSCHHNGNPQLPQQIQWSFSRMVCSTIQSPDCIPSPIGSLLVKFFHKRLPEQAHHAFVGIWLSKSYVRVSYRVDCRQNWHSWRDLECTHRVIGSRELPFHPSEVAHSEPGFVQIAYDSGFQVLLQQLDCPLLSKNQTPLRICAESNMLHFPVSHSQISHNLASFWLFDFNIPLIPARHLISFDLIRHHFAGIYENVVVSHLFNNLLH